jgi:hypothetical protein
MVRAVGIDDDNPSSEAGPDCLKTDRQVLGLVLYWNSNGKIKQLSERCRVEIQRMKGNGNDKAWMTRNDNACEGKAVKNSIEERS